MAWPGNFRCDRINRVLLPSMPEPVVDVIPDRDFDIAIRQRSNAQR